MEDRIMSVAEYAKLQKRTRQFITWQIRNNKLPPNITAKRAGRAYILIERCKVG